MSLPGVAKSPSRSRDGGGNAFRNASKLKELGALSDALAHHLARWKRNSKKAPAEFAH